MDTMLLPYTENKLVLSLSCVLVSGEITTSLLRPLRCKFMTRPCMSSSSVFACTTVFCIRFIVWINSI